MKNIIFTIVDQNFFKFFKYFYRSLRSKNKSIDLLCITPENLDLKYKDIKQLKLKDFDSKFNAKYRIVEWEEFEAYDNYLYLDCDIYFLRDPVCIFLEIEKENYKLHGIREAESLNKANYQHNFNKTMFEIDSPCFNAGSFGFNKKIKNKIIDFLSYIEKNKEKAWTDQPLFNIYFYNSIIESLDKHIEIFDLIKPINPKIIHLAGFTYQSKGKEKKYQKFFKKDTRGEILLLLPEESNVGLFNCGDYYENQQIKFAKEELNKKCSIYKNDYSKNKYFYDFVFIDNATSIENLIEIIRKIYPQVKYNGIIASITGKGHDKKVLKHFIESSGLDFFECYEDDVFFTIKI